MWRWQRHHRFFFNHRFYRWNSDNVGHQSEKSVLQPFAGVGSIIQNPVAIQKNSADMLVIAMD